MSKKYQVIFKFRNGAKLEVFYESVILRKGDNTFYNLLHLDNVGMAALTSGLPNYDSNNNYLLYNARTLPALFDIMPEDWDKTETSLKLVDEIFVNTLPQERA